MDAPLVFNQITPAKFDSICAKAQAAAGVAISGLQGTASRSTAFGDVAIMWDYNPMTQLLTIQCMKRPWGSEGKIETTLRQLVEEA